MSFASQSLFDIRVEWGLRGVEALADCRTFVIVDVLSFSTSVSVAIQRGVSILPYRWKDATAADHAAQHQALLAGERGQGYSLSPRSLENAPAGTRLVLPSPNGSTISLEAARHGHVLAGCLRNRTAVSARAASLGGPIAVIPAGERWPDGSLRPALEDLLGAGAIVSLLPGRRSPEAAAAAALFAAMCAELPFALDTCASGRELRVFLGFPEDVAAAARLDVDPLAPELVGDMFLPRP